MVSFMGKRQLHPIVKQASLADYYSKEAFASYPCGCDGFARPARHSVKTVLKIPSARGRAEAVPRVEELMAPELNHNQTASKET
jgi:hypothetical protein